MKKTKAIAIGIMIITILFFMINPVTKATIDPGEYNPGEIDTGDIEPVINIAGVIVNTLATIGIVVSVITLIIIGLKYMMGSVEEKAEYKKTMIPYIVGVVMVVAITQILKLIVELVDKVEV